MEFPTPFSGRMFKKFEENNNVSLRVFGCEILSNNTRIIPLYVSTEKREKIVRLFFYKNEDGTKSHYNTVKDMSRLVSSQYSKRARRNIRDFCLNAFGRQNLLDENMEYCSKHDAVNVTMPKPGRNILKFRNIQNSGECPIKIIFIFESFLKPTDKIHGKTKLYQQHVSSAFCIYVVSRVEGFSMDPITYVCQNQDDDVSKVFVEKLEEVTKKFTKLLKNPDL